MKNQHGKTTNDSFKANKNTLRRYDTQNTDTAHIQQMNCVQFNNQKDYQFLEYCTRTTSNLTAMFGIHKENEDKNHNDMIEMISGKSNCESKFGQHKVQINPSKELKEFSDSSKTSESEKNGAEEGFENHDRIEQGELVNSPYNTKGKQTKGDITNQMSGNSDQEAEENKDKVDTNINQSNKCNDKKKGIRIHKIKESNGIQNNKSSSK